MRQNILTYALKVMTSQLNLPCVSPKWKQIRKRTKTRTDIVQKIPFGW